MDMTEVQQMGGKIVLLEHRFRVGCGVGFSTSWFFSYLVILIWVLRDPWMSDAVVVVVVVGGGVDVAAVVVFDDVAAGVVVTWVQLVL